MRLCIAVCFLLTSATLSGQSVYTQRPDDPHAVYMQAGSFAAHADGVGDDADALQAAIDRVQETTGQGIVFLRDGYYRLSHTVYLWQGVRVIGYGAHRPVLLLAPDTPGFQTGHGYLGTGKYMVQFAERRPAPGQPIVDANEFTFYSAMSNIDFEIGSGNPAAIAVRFHVAQHSFLSHMRFSVGDGRAALEDVGNQASDLRIEGGEYGIVTKRTAPAWQFLLMDSQISGQRTAAIHTEEAGMTLVRVQMAHVPVAVEITHGMPEQLYGRDLTLTDVARTGIVLGDVTSQHHQITLEHVACDHVSRLLEGGEGVVGWSSILGPSPIFVEDKLTLGQEIDNTGREGAIALRHHETTLHIAPKAIPSDIPPLPPVSEWANVHSLGVQGDGGTDDLPALQRAVDTHRVLYLPEGVYRLRGSLKLKPDTVLIGFSPVATQLTLWDEDPIFMGPGEAVPLLITPKNGETIVSGIGVSAGDVAPRAAGVLWQSGPRSFMDDVNFPRGRGHLVHALAPNLPPAPASVRAQENRSTQYPSLWVSDGGGGIFRDVWTADTIARAGLMVENSTTPSVVYQLSCEHHMHNEVKMVNASHWKIYALQTEEEMPDGAAAVALELDHVQDLTFANQFEYRVSRQIMPKQAGSVVRDSTEVRWENMHDFSMTRLAFDNSVEDESTGVKVRTHDFTGFTITANTTPGAPLPLAAMHVFAPGAKLEMLADGFSNASGLTVDDAGELYFTDSARHRVYRWDAGRKVAEVLTEDIAAPQSAVSVTPQWMLVVDVHKQIWAVAKNGATRPIKIAGEDTPRSPTQLVLPVGLHEEIAALTRLVEHKGFVYAPRSNMATTGVVDDEPRQFFYAPGINVAILAGGTWKPLLQSSQEQRLGVGESALAVSESDDKVYRITLNALNRMSATPFIARGGTSVVRDAQGNVYVAGAQVFVYDAAGKPLGALEMPERPESLVIGGKDRRTLFVGARSGLYAIGLRPKRSEGRAAEPTSTLPDLLYFDTGVAGAGVAVRRNR